MARNIDKEDDEEYETVERECDNKAETKLGKEIIASEIEVKETEVVDIEGDLEDEMDTESPAPKVKRARNMTEIEHEAMGKQEQLLR